MVINKKIDIKAKCFDLLLKSKYFSQENVLLRNFF